MCELKNQVEGLIMNKQYSQNPLVPIGQLAEFLKIHPRTLRIYEDEKILIPKRSCGNRRLYSIADIEKAKLILFLTRNLALNLSGVKVILEIFKKINIVPENYLNFINEIAKSANIKQDENILKTSRRGRNKNSC
ncbi:MAG: MerR family transcriptional regulator [Candidatus Gastranaerophilales bacterium]|nr:MerR family transcriptional regulator [Candidatus Gastranaerophilales bacterium]